MRPKPLSGRARAHLCAAGQSAALSAPHAHGAWHGSGISRPRYARSLIRHPSRMPTRPPTRPSTAVEPPQAISPSAGSSVRFSPWLSGQHGYQHRPAEDSRCSETQLERRGCGGGQRDRRKGRGPPMQVRRAAIVALRAAAIEWLTNEDTAASYRIVSYNPSRQDNTTH